VRRFHSRSKVNLGAEDLAKELKLADSVELHQKLRGYVRRNHFGDSLVILQHLGVERVEVKANSTFQVSEGVSQSNHLLWSFLGQTFGHILGHRPSSDILTIGPVEVSELMLKVVNKQFIKAL
jgi:hypothetical protein